MPASKDAADTSPAATAEGPSLAVEAEGLRWFLPPGGAARPIPFGTPQAAVLASLERVRGPADQGTNSECGAGPLQYANWADGLGLLFQDGRFVGWALDGRAEGAIGTANGVGPGVTRAVLDSAFGTRPEVRETTLGTEWSAGDLHGLLDGRGPASKITNMWAGTSCNFR